jgi:signal transduction histidine kinase
VTPDHRSHSRTGGKPSLQWTLLFLIAAALLTGIIPAGVALDRRIMREFEERVREDLARAPGLLLDHHTAVSDALMMYAKELAHAPGLPEALDRGDREGALRIVEASRASPHVEPMVRTGTNEVWTGPTYSMRALVEATRSGEMPVSVVCDGRVLRIIGLAPVERGGHWIGVAGVAAPLDQAMAATLAGITRSDLVFLGKGGSLTTTSALAENGRALGRLVADWPRDGQVRELEHEGRRYLATAAILDDATVVFLRDMQRELAVVPTLRRVAAASGLGALGVALLLGALLAMLLARPVRILADASDRLAEGDFDAPLPSSPVRELDRVSRAFGVMRRSLATRLDELESANRELAERQVRLTALQSELIQRERHAVGARLVAELAHEIRNPVANLRNCLELLHRRLRGDPEGQEFAGLAINELLRMHELAERMLHLNRPRDPAITHCDAAEVAREVAALAGAGRRDGELQISVLAGGAVEAAISPDALKQVLLNLLQNARDARPAGLVVEIAVWREGGHAVIEVLDNGPGIPEEMRKRVFEPFVTTKGEAGGAGLGLFVVEGTLRRYGGWIVLCSSLRYADDDPEALSGACFYIKLPLYTGSSASDTPSALPAAKTTPEITPVVEEIT